MITIRTGIKTDCINIGIGINLFQKNQKKTKKHPKNKRCSSSDYIFINLLILRTLELLHRTPSFKSMLAHHVVHGITFLISGTCRMGEQCQISVKIPVKW